MQNTRPDKNEMNNVVYRFLCTSVVSKQIKSQVCLRCQSQRVELGLDNKVYTKSGFFSFLNIAKFNHKYMKASIFFLTLDHRRRKYGGSSPNSLRPISYFGRIWELHVLDLKTSVFCRKKIQLHFPMNKRLTVPQQCQ